MKKLITFLALSFLAITVFGQTQVNSKFLSDRIWIPKGAVEVRPVIVDTKGDSARSVSWHTGNMPRDTTSYIAVFLDVYDKSGGLLISLPQTTPMSGYTKWTALTSIIDSFILSQYPRILTQ